MVVDLDAIAMIRSMATDPLDDKITASVREAETLLKSLPLTDEQRTWAQEHGKWAFHSVSEIFLKNDEAMHGLPSSVVPAALAFALVMARDWSEHTEKVADKIRREGKP